MTTLSELQDFCKNKSIIIVGNSSQMLGHNNGRMIDGYDIVVRINRGYKLDNSLAEKIGNKTDIVSIGIKSALQAAQVIGSNKVSYILSPIIYSDKLPYPNAHNIEPSLYHKLKEDLGGTKPSTGISTFNFFYKMIDYKKLDLIGFDFFETSNIRKNELGHMLVTDHNGEKEKAYVKESLDPLKNTFHILSTRTTYVGNIPRITIKR
jgi:hypothetical protein